MLTKATGYTTLVPVIISSFTASDVLALHWLIWCYVVPCCYVLRMKPWNKKKK